MDPKARSQRRLAGLALAERDRLVIRAARRCDGVIGRKSCINMAERKKGGISA